MVDEVIEFLRLQPGQTVLDATVGCGGHAAIILRKVMPGGKVIGVDRDRENLAQAETLLKKSGGTFSLIHENFKNIDSVLGKIGIPAVNGALFDLGISSTQLEDKERGFSFERDGFLDMRMDPSGGVRAYDIVNRFSRKEIEEIIRDFGEERYFRRIAAGITEERQRGPLRSTGELAMIIGRAVGRKYRGQKIHPATRTFQALRIATNGELDNLRTAMEKIRGVLMAGARACVISFHSLEDRIVKRAFRAFAKETSGTVITKKPLTATRQEIRENPRARSAKMRVFEKR
jgi:16S rRNA (cytosine1402-N4)-methyltransferase